MSPGDRPPHDRKLGGVAHLGERLNGIQEVRGSIPLISTKEKERQNVGSGALLFLQYRGFYLGGKQYG